MMKKTKLAFLFLFPALLTSCLDMGNADDVRPIIEPPETILLKKDSLTSGRHYGITIGQTAARAYPAAQFLKDSLKVDYLNLVANYVSNYDGFEMRLPLYSYMTFDEKNGTEQGVQLWFENKKLKSIYLNSGKRLGQWPENLHASEAVREGDNSEQAAGKLHKLQKDSRYKSRFEHAMLGVKTLAEPYDPAMDSNPEWYFAHTIDDHHFNVVHVHFREGIVSHILVNHMKTF